jgi:phosphatidylglycerophosphatase A
LAQWYTWIATAFGVGKVPVAPGTAGSLVGLFIVILLYAVPPAVYLGLVLFILALGWYCAGRVEKASGIKDHPTIVIDEIAGMMISAFGIPHQAGFLASAFVLFRIFDIIKPFPAGWLERKIPGGGGIMLDDVAAGVYANVILQGILRLL